jgi:hypothetical protein
MDYTYFILFSSQTIIYIITLFVYILKTNKEIKRLTCQQKAAIKKINESEWAIKVFRENVQISDIKIQNVLQYQEKLAEKLHTNILYMHEMINKTQCETVGLNDRIYSTRRELEIKIAGFIQMQEKIVLYIQENISDLRKIQAPPFQITDTPGSL